MYYSMTLRTALNSDKRVVDDFEEFGAQPRTLLLIPNERVFDIRRGRRTDNDVH